MQDHPADIAAAELSIAKKYCRANKIAFANDAAALGEFLKSADGMALSNAIAGFETVMKTTHNAVNAAAANTLRNAALAKVRSAMRCVDDTGGSGHEPVAMVAASCADDTDGDYDSEGATDFDRPDGATHPDRAPTASPMRGAIGDTDKSGLRRNRPDPEAPSRGQVGKLSKAEEKVFATIINGAKGSTVPEYVSIFKSYHDFLVERRAQ